MSTTSSGTVRGYANLPLVVLRSIAKEFKVLRPRVMRELLIRAQSHKSAIGKATTAVDSKDEESLLEKVLVEIGMIQLLDYEEMSPRARAQYSFSAMSGEEKSAFIRAMLYDPDMDSQLDTEEAK